MLYLLLLCESGAFLSFIFYHGQGWGVQECVIDLWVHLCQHTSWNHGPLGQGDLPPSSVISSLSTICILTTHFIPNLHHHSFQNANPTYLLSLMLSIRVWIFWLWLELFTFQCATISSAGAGSTLSSIHGQNKLQGKTEIHTTHVTHAIYANQLKEMYAPHAVSHPRPKMYF